jgi:predicted DNA-binding transcriptional regulator AlpA
MKKKMAKKKIKHEGRPSKLTDVIQSKIVKAIRAGNYIETAAAYAGISKTTLYKWMQKGSRKEAPRYAAFVNAVERALAESEVRDVMTIGTAAERGDWRAAAWRLERKNYERWGKREVYDLNLDGEMEISESPKVLTREEAELLEMIEDKDESGD